MPVPGRTARSSSAGCWSRGRRSRSAVFDPIRDEGGWSFDRAGTASTRSTVSTRLEAYLPTPDLYRAASRCRRWLAYQALGDRQQFPLITSTCSSRPDRRTDAADPTPTVGGQRSRRDQRPIYTEVNNGVYRAGFAATQEAYDDGLDGLFAGGLARGPARRSALPDGFDSPGRIRLFTTLVRFDAVYHGHFKCNRGLIDYPNLWGYARDLYQRPGFGDTVNFDHIKRHTTCPPDAEPDAHRAQGAGHRRLATAFTDRARLADPQPRRPRRPYFPPRSGACSTLAAAASARRATILPEIRNSRACATTPITAAIMVIWLADRAGQGRPVLAQVERLCPALSPASVAPACAPCAAACAWPQERVEPVECSTRHLAVAAVPRPRPAG